MAYYTVFLDESGHSGRAAGADPSQPAYVLAGVWLSRAQQIAVANDVLEWKRGARIQAPELKFSKLIRKPRGHSFLLSVIELLRESRVPVSVSIIAKLFFPSAILVEDATDYVFNPRFDESWTWPIPKKRALRDWIASNLPTPMANRLLRSRDQDPEAYAEAADRALRHLLLAAKHPQLCFLLEQMRHTEFRDCCRTALRCELKYSPNLTAFREFLNEGNKLALALGCDCDLVHDDQNEFAREFSRLQQLLRNARSNENTTLAALGVHFPVDRVRSLTFARSSATIELQIADCIAGATRYALANRGSELGLAIARLLREAGCEVFPFVFGPDEWTHDVAVWLFGS
jgi:hypothetical protein